MVSEKAVTSVKTGAQILHKHLKRVMAASAAMTGKVT
jgi:hypothetical protein